MPICAIYGCSSEWQQDGSVRLFGLPSIINHLCGQTKTLSAKRRALWLARINRDLRGRKLTSSSIKVCYKHFVKGKPSALFDHTNPDWAPSLNLGYGRSEQSTALVKKSVDRYARAKARQSKRYSLNEPSSSSGQDVVQVEDLDTEETTPQSIAGYVDNNDEEMEQPVDRVVDVTMSEELPNSPPFSNIIEGDMVDGERIKRNFESLVNIDASEEQPQNPLSPSRIMFTDAVDGERIKRNFESLVNIDASGEQPQNPLSPSRIMFTDAMGRVVETTDFGCPADMHAEAESDLRTKCRELFTQNCHLLERISSMESQLVALALGKEELQSERDRLLSERESFSLDNIHLRGEISELRTQLKRATISEKDFKDDNEKTQFYTGLPSFDLLEIVYNVTEGHVTHSCRNAMPKFTEFLMALMRLRLGCLEQDLAYRFHVAQSTVSAVCSKWITAMTTTLSDFIVWPERSVLCKTMPACFRDVFGDKVAVIVDCFELFIGRPSSLGPQAETWSQYKHHNTVKFLIGITPQGTVSFVSNGYEGRSSNEHITLASGILDKLLPGDVIMADRGFDIADDVSMRRASLAKGKDQLSFDYVQKTRQIANVRIHVERLIGCIKRKFRILSGSACYSYHSCNCDTEQPPIDGIVKVCCALTNLCPPLIPDEN